MSLPVDISFNRTKFAVALLFFLPLLAGCANPGPPHPPSLHLPEAASDLRAERVGDEVRLNWTTSSKTTDGIDITGPLTAQICRSSSPSVCSPIQSVPVKPGPSETVDPLPSALRADPQSLLEYRVAILNSRQRSAGLSSPAFAAAGSAPPTVTRLRIEATAQGALLQWEPKDASDAIELDRQQLVSTATSSRKSGQNFQTTSKEPAEMRFRASTEGLPFRSDAGGTVDATTRQCETYTYTVQRVRAVTLQGHALEIRSALSLAVTLNMRDSFPPKPPTGLETILAGRTAASPSIDLSWRPNTESDLAGYLVYRQELGSDETAAGSRQKLTAEPILEPGFHDAAVAGAHTYAYSITAVDTSGNESPPSAPARQDVPLP